MTTPFAAVRISERVYWVGAIDWKVRNFHGYATTRGTTYNAYLIMADRITLVDSVKKPFKAELMARVASVVDPGRIDYVVSNHAEMDHSGCLFEVIDEIHPEKVFASPNGVKALRAHFHTDREIVTLKDGDVVDLGNMSLNAVLTPMVHWPDSMVTWLPEDKVLFSQDGFGMHLASHERFVDELPASGVWYEAAKYYANILMPLAPQIQKVLAKLGDLNLPIEVLANDHGPLWRGDIGRILERYGAWSARMPRRKAVVVYDSMWLSTEAMARSIGDGLAAKGVAVKVMPLEASHRSDVALEILEAGALLVGSPTINNQMFPSVADVLCYLKGLKPRNLVGAAFGSYGWSGQGADLVADELKAIGIEVVAEPLKVQYVPDTEALGRCRAWGEAIGETLVARCEAAVTA